MDIIVDPGGPNEAHYSTNSANPATGGAFSTQTGTANNAHSIYAKAGNLPNGIIPGTIVGNGDIDLDGTASLSEDGQIRFLENINPNGDPVFLSYIAGVPDSSVTYFNVEQPVALDWETNFSWTAVTADRNGGDTAQGMSFVIQADPDGINAIGLNNPATNYHTGASGQSVRGNGGLELDPYIEVKFDYDWDRNNDGNRGQLVVARNGINGGYSELVNIEFPFGELMQQNIAGAQGDHVRGNQGDTSETDPGSRSSQLYQYNAANFTANIEYDSAAEELIVVIDAIDENGTVVATSGPVLATNFNVAELLGTGSAFVGFSGATSNNSGSASLISSFDFTGTFSNDQHHQNIGTQGEDVAIGEQVTFGLVVDVPEGTTEHLVVTDILPAGLELVDLEIATTVAEGGGLLDGDFLGRIDTDRITVEVYDPNTASVLATYSNLADLQTTPPSGPVELRLRFEDPIVNEHDDIQAAADDDASNIPSSFNNDQFVIKVVTRVLNGEDYNPTDNGALDNLPPAVTNEVTDSAGGNVGVDTSLSDNAHDPDNLDSHDHADLLNDSRLTYADGANGERTTFEGNSVEIDLVEPELKLEKEFVNTSNPGSSVVKVGETAFFVVEISHTQLADGDSTQSTADAFNVNIFDNLGNDNGKLSTALGNGDARIVKLEIISAPGYINSGEPVALYDFYNNVPVATNVDGIYTTSSETGSDLERGMPSAADGSLQIAPNITNNIVDFTLDELRLGDKFVFAYEISMDNTTLVDRNIGGDETQDIVNEAHATYYSLPL
ncbi:MAG: hypothetical protein AAF226_10470, partial [Verrucomicrobiota bacterium]